MTTGAAAGDQVGPGRAGGTAPGATHPLRPGAQRGGHAPAGVAGGEVGQELDRVAGRGRDGRRRRADRRALVGATGPARGGAGHGSRGGRRRAGRGGRRPARRGRDGARRRPRARRSSAPGDSPAPGVVPGTAGTARGVVPRRGVVPARGVEAPPLWSAGRPGVVPSVRVSGFDGSAVSRQRHRGRGRAAAQHEPGGDHREASATAAAAPRRAAGDQPVAQQVERVVHRASNPRRSAASPRETRWRTDLLRAAHPLGDLRVLLLAQHPPVDRDALGLGQAGERLGQVGAAALGDRGQRRFVRAGTAPCRCACAPCRHLAAPLGVGDDVAGGAQQPRDRRALARLVRRRCSYARANVSPSRSNSTSGCRVRRPRYAVTAPTWRS